jgi:hypothetical protein
MNQKVLDVTGSKDIEGSKVGLNESKIVKNTRTKEVEDTSQGTGTCYRKPKDGTPIKGCKCHPSCGTCGYSNNPVREIDCIKCSDSSVDLTVMFGTGTGKCVRNSSKKDQKDEHWPATINAANQRWRVVYLDQAKKVQTEGLNEDFGFYVNRPFYIVSRLPMHRVAESIGANNITLKRWRKNVKAQQWKFDPVAKVIRNNYWTNYVMTIQSNGASSNLRT